MNVTLILTTVEKMQTVSILLVVSHVCANLAMLEMELIVNHVSLKVLQLVTLEMEPTVLEVAKSYRTIVHVPPQYRQMEEEQVPIIKW